MEIEVREPAELIDCSIFNIKHNDNDNPDNCVAGLVRGHVTVETIRKLERIALSGTGPDPTRPYPIKTAKHYAMGLALHASRDISTGEVILAERPLLVIPDQFYRWMSTDESDRDQGISQGLHNQLCLERWKKNGLESLFSRMDPKNRAALMELSTGNPSTRSSDSSRVAAIIKDNRLPLNVLNDQDRKVGYLGICKTISRINHSCIPNSILVFNEKLFSYEIRAVRPIQQDDAITFSYLSLYDGADCPDTMSYNDRNWKLIDEYGFTCRCFSCIRSSPDDSDQVRGTLGRSVIETRSKYLDWLSNPALDDGHVIEYCLRWLKTMDEWSLQALPHYRFFVQIAHAAALALKNQPVAASLQRFFLPRLAAQSPVQIFELYRLHSSLDLENTWGGRESYGDGPANLLARLPDCDGWEDAKDLQGFTPFTGFNIR
ncbi:hypothetical protein BDQ12DRAFT_677988 [Crucibulum laeve]|uniref:SET domain-containing protein n=1 Tax=Crucibulum laeve TaxID=68775 RepID=A0A5C3MJS6_9AGAR|nr:hypothetical protein BDQ12DRAFT_677988 [Crucibulum laeve]